MLLTMDTLSRMYAHPEFPRKLFSLSPPDDLTDQSLHTPHCSRGGRRARASSQNLWLIGCDCVADPGASAPHRFIAPALVAADELNRFEVALGEAFTVLAILGDRDNVEHALRYRGGRIRQAADRLYNWSGTSGLTVALTHMRQSVLDGDVPTWMSDIVEARLHELEQAFKDRAAQVSWRDVWHAVAPSSATVDGDVVLVMRRQTVVEPLGGVNVPGNLLRVMCLSTPVLAEHGDLVAFTAPAECVQHLAEWKICAAPLPAVNAPEVLSVAMAGLNEELSHDALSTLLTAATAAVE